MSSTSASASAIAAAAPLSLVETIAAKRDGRALSSREIDRLITAFGSGELADYQMSAWLMAVFFRGMTDEETVSLTNAMLHSGKVLALDGVPGFKVDKHSTGGVGDKVSICLAPLVAASGVPVPMVSGRGLGHTGGTLDKLEAIPGFSTSLDVLAFTRIVGEIGCCMIGQTAEIAPADKRIYALRDVTATVECTPLIVASILSKKLAEGIDGLVLDVKVGRGAFMKDLEQARGLAEALVRVGTRAGKNVRAVITAMDTPLGRTIGNASETKEALDVLHGKGPDDLIECTFVLGAEMLIMGGKAKTVEEARALLQKAIDSGKAAETMARMIAAQGGDASVVASPEKLAVGQELRAITADRSGFVTSLDAREVGLAAVAMGAGRTRADQPVDPEVGILLHKKPGDRVGAGEVLAELQLRKGAANAHAGSTAARVGAAYVIGDEAPAAQPLVVSRIPG